MFIGLDVGMHADHSALVLAGAWSGNLIGVVDVKQFSLGTPFEELADDVASISRENRAKILVDASNNSAFVGVLAARLPQPPANHLVAATITGAATHASQPTPMPIMVGGLRAAVPRWTLSKPELIETIGAEMGANLLRFAHEGDWQTLRDELTSMERTVRASGSAAYSAPSGKHDDLVLALALAVFAARRFARPPTPPRRHGRPPSSLAWT